MMLVAGDICFVFFAGELLPRFLEIESSSLLEDSVFLVLFFEAEGPTKDFDLISS